jgi:hypothetical protein
MLPQTSIPDSRQVASSWP